MNFSNIQNGFILMGIGIAGVFLVLVIFYFLIKLLAKAFPEKMQENGEQS